MQVFESRGMFPYTMYMEHEVGALRRRPRSFFARMRRVVAYLFIRMGSALWHSIARDVRLVAVQWRLFVGATLVVVGVFSFSSSMYCDGNTSAYAVCTRPSTYYFYPWWAIVLAVVGVWCLLLWFVRRE
jgi:hypothetical protein